TGFYKEKYEPPSATEWDDAENNKQFLKYNTLMTANPTLSIPASQMLDEETYFQRMGSVTWPNGLDGKPLESVLQVRPLMIFNNARSKQAKIVVSSMLNDVGLDKFVEGSQGRYLPVFKSSQRNEFWNDASDSHIQVAIKTVESFRQPYAVKNKAYSAVIKQRVWSEAIEDVALGKLDSEAATNQLVARITDIFDQWS
ncbi:MAG TPA: carbohydrate ABC transporter substrate-binding protein, partial [Prochlorococcus sp.]